MRIASMLLMCVVLGATTVVDGATRTVDFSDDTAGQPPKGFAVLAVIAERAHSPARLDR
jgi:hypothetical protein